MRRRRFWLLTVLALALAGCVSVAQAAPMCSDDGRDSLVLLAQSVPEAELVPCLGALPAGWSVNEVTVKNSRSHLWIGISRFDESRIDLTFTERCELGDAVEVPSDEEQVRRFEDVGDIDRGYHGTSYHTFPGGCVTVAYNIPGEGWSGVVNDASALLTFTPRSELERYVRARSGGLIEDL